MNGHLCLPGAADLPRNNCLGVGINTSPPPPTDTNWAPRGGAALGQGQSWCCLTLSRPQCLEIRALLSSWAFPLAAPTGKKSLTPGLHFWGLVALLSPPIQWWRSNPLGVVRCSCPFQTALNCIWNGIDPHPSIEMEHPTLPQLRQQSRSHLQQPKDTFPGLVCGFPFHILSNQES